jgi:hypothetical protein
VGLFLDCLKEPEAEDCESAADDGHPEGESNYRRCLHLLGAVGIPFRPPHPSGNLPKNDDLAWLLLDSFNESAALDGGSAELLASIDRLRVLIARRTHFHAAAAEWSAKSELRDGDSSIVTLS